MNSSEPLRRHWCVGELPGQPELAGRGLARDLLLLTATQTFLGAVDHPIEQLVGLQRRGRQPVVERVAHGILDDAAGLDGGELVLGLTLETPARE